MERREGSERWEGDRDREGEIGRRGGERGSKRDERPTGDEDGNREAGTGFVVIPPNERSFRDEETRIRHRKRGR